MELIYHICPRSAWEATIGDYRSDSLESEGFIHCSTIRQVPRVLNLFYSNQTCLVLLELDVNHLASELRWEPGTDKPDEQFPHVYGPINKRAVIRVIDIEEDMNENILHTAD